MRIVTSLIVVAAMVFATLPAHAQRVLGRDAETSAFQQLAAGIPAGSRIKVRTTDGRRLTATLMAVEAQQIVVKRLSRVPEPAIAIAFTDLTELRREERSGFSVGKAIGIGLAAGAGAILTLFALAMTIDD
jgi:hypothetical protein